MKGCFFFFFFFSSRRRHTRFSRDWSSDVCSSDLHLQALIATVGYTHDPAWLAPVAAQVPDAFVEAVTLAGTVEDVATCVRRMAQQGIKHIMVYPQVPDGDVERVLN